jgi:PTH2 family peptidyl-tRNA hydrolase
MYCMYAFINKRLNMTHGKMGVQVGHAVVFSMRMTVPFITEQWFNNCLQRKIVLEAKDETELSEIQKLLESKGFMTQEVHDAGLTELEPNSYTALAVEIVDKDLPEVKEVFKQYKLYKAGP